MRYSPLLFLVILAAALRPALAQSERDVASGNWRSPDRASSALRDPASTSSAERPIDSSRHAASTPLVPLRTAGREAMARRAGGSGSLPNEQGQIWREYDISPYSLRLSESPKPQQAIVDWILRETGYEAWHGDPVALLCASRRTLRVYHTPEMQEVVSDVVERFVSVPHEDHAFSVRLITLNHPNWRTTTHRMLEPVPVQTQGAQAWLLAKEDAALLVAELARRHDYRAHNSPQAAIKNGRGSSLLATRPRSYVKGFVATGASQSVPPQPDLGKLDEGFRFDVSPLLSLDGRTADAIVKLTIDQVERTVAVDSGGLGLTSEVPQMAGFRLHERFRWPADKVLLVSTGMVPSPTPRTAGGLAIPFTGQSANRCEMLLMFESVGSVSTPSAATASR